MWSADYGLPCSQAAAEQEAQQVMSVCSAVTRPWFMAHAPDLLMADPASAAVLERPIDHMGGDQVHSKTLGERI